MERGFKLTIGSGLKRCRDWDEILGGSKRTRLILERLEALAAAAAAATPDAWARMFSAAYKNLLVSRMLGRNKRAFCLCRTRFESSNK
jgi:hypothetical protein